MMSNQRVNRYTFSSALSQRVPSKTWQNHAFSLEWGEIPEEVISLLPSSIEAWLRVAEEQGEAWLRQQDAFGLDHYYQISKGEVLSFKQKLSQGQSLEELCSDHEQGKVFFLEAMKNLCLKNASNYLSEAKSASDDAFQRQYLYIRNNIPHLHVTQFSRLLEKLLEEAVGSYHRLSDDAALENPINLAIIELTTLFFQDAARRELDEFGCEALMQAATLYNHAIFGEMLQKHVNEIAPQVRQVLLQYYGARDMLTNQGEELYFSALPLQAKHNYLKNPPASLQHSTVESLKRKLIKEAQKKGQRKFYPPACSQLPTQARSQNTSNNLPVRIATEEEIIFTACSFKMKMEYMQNPPATLCPDLAIEYVRSLLESAIKEEKASPGCNALKKVVSLCNNVNLVRILQDPNTLILTEMRKQLRLQCSENGALNIQGEALYFSTLSFNNKIKYLGRLQQPFDPDLIAKLATVLFWEAIESEAENNNCGALARALQLYGTNLGDILLEKEKQIMADIEQKLAQHEGQPELKDSVRKCLKATQTMCLTYQQMKCMAACMPEGSKKTICNHNAAKIRAALSGNPTSTPNSPRVNRGSHQTVIYRVEQCITALDTETVPALKPHYYKLQKVLSWLLKPVKAVREKSFTSLAYYESAKAINRSLATAKTIFAAYGELDTRSAN